MISQIRPTIESDPAGTGLEPAADAWMWWSSTKRAAMRGSGLIGFDAVMNHTAGRCLRTLADRENWYLKLGTGNEAACGAYLKKHRGRTWRTRLRAWLRIGPGETAGRVEARNVQQLSAEGIRVMDLLAYGERLSADGRLESFLLTEELAGYEELQALVERRFPAADAMADNCELDRLIGQVSRITAKLHRAGYNHRDLYCCHFLVKEVATGQFDVRLIDLQRVQHRRRWRRRWIVKDLAQLAYSAPRNHLRNTQRLAFIKDYLGVEKLRPEDKRLIGSVLAKQRRMERKLMRKQRTAEATQTEAAQTDRPMVRVKWTRSSASSPAIRPSETALANGTSSPSYEPGEEA